MVSPRRSRVDDAIRRGAPVLLTALLAVGYLAGVVVVGDSAAIEPLPGSTGGDPDATGTLHGWLPALLVLVQAAALVLRRRLPVAVLLVAAGLDTVMLALSSAELGIGSLAVMIAGYSVARHRRDRRALAAIGAVAVVQTAVALIAVQSSAEVPAAWSVPFALLRAALVFALPVAVAEFVRGRAQLLEALRERAVAAENERERRAEEAVTRERASMARELHDIAAHHLTGIIVSAQAAEALLTADPKQAAGYLRSVQDDARTTLGNLRQTVGLLRTDGAGDRAPSPSLEQLPQLVAEAASTGTEVRFAVSGTPVELGPVAGITVYRMVQESLANARRHAPSAERAVEVAYGEGSVRVSVRNGAAGNPVPSAAPHGGGRTDVGGFGLIGMRERAALVNATLRTGPLPGGGWVNTLEVPYDGAAS